MTDTPNFMLILYADINGTIDIKYGKKYNSTLLDSLDTLKDNDLLKVLKHEFTKYKCTEMKMDDNPNVLDIIVFPDKTIKVLALSRDKPSYNIKPLKINRLPSIFKEILLELGIRKKGSRE